MHFFDKMFLDPLPACPFLAEQLSMSKYLEGQGCRVPARISVTRRKNILANHKQLWLVVRSHTWKIKGMLLQLIQVIEIHIIQSRSSEFVFLQMT